MIKNENDIIELIQKDEWMMKLLKTVKVLNLPDGWICAGFVRSKIWDTLHGYGERTTLQDIDVIYYDDKNRDKKMEKQLEKTLISLLPNVPWSVKNEARMHSRNGVEPYISSTDAIAKFPETATALGIKLDKQDNLVLIAPHGIKDVINLTVRPTPYFTANKERIAVYENRIQKKNWKLTWNRLIITQHINE
nr:nucleotidyltransferase family protein [Planococcus antarcticus]